MKLLDLMAASVTPLVAWARAGFSDPGSGSGTGSSASVASGDEGMMLEEIRNHAVSTLCRAIIEADEGLFFSPQACLQCFNTLVFAMVDDLLEKATEKKFMEGTVEMAMEVLVEVFLRLVERMGTVSGFRTFWLGVLRRLDTGMKADVGGGSVREMIPGLLRKMIVDMMEKGILVERDGDELWDITNIQIQWIAPSLKEELFPEDEF
ncbi:hypothetical protein AMTR_s00017p00207110 [Amborella trichopoda]|uniref:Uncharacterized protein n=1 Tax=Amborella trichopoda TaxID=13333 RepID=W1PLU5_AMBTC|nr:hypothetical protein AMTR_s00017p00207110 [Amborella trichopoda]